MTRPTLIELKACYDVIFLTGDKMRSIPSIFYSKSVGDFLKEYADFFKNQFGADEFKTWAERCGIYSRITFGLYSRNKKKLPEIVQKNLEQELDLSESAKQRLRSMNTTDFGTEKAAQYTEDNYFYVTDDFFSTPLHTIVLNLCDLEKPLSESEIKKTLRGLFQEKEIQNSIELLLRLNLIKIKSKDQLRRHARGTLTTLPGRRSVGVAGYYQKTYDMAQAAQALPLTEREFGAFTIRIDSSSLPKIKDLARNFRRDIETIEKEAAPTSVYQCAVAVFPVYHSDSK